MKELICQTAWPMETPAMFGPFHLIFVAVSAVICVCLAVLLRSLSRRTVLLILSTLGWLLIASEIYKQLFYYYVVNEERYDWWWFPFQLCSVPMYLGVPLPFLKEKAQTTVGTFFGTYTFLGAVFALAVPADMLRPYLTMTLHAFLWHAILLFMSLISITTGLWEPSRKAFFRATRLFLFLALAAAGINMVGERHTFIPGTYPNMFYITPYHYNTQPVFQDISSRYGIMAGNMVYLAAVILGAAIFHLLWGVTRKTKGCPRSEASSKAKHF